MKSKHELAYFLTVICMKCELYCAAREFEYIKKHSFMTQDDFVLFFYW